MTIFSARKISDMKKFRAFLIYFWLLPLAAAPLLAASIVRPVLAITSPKAGQLWSNDTFSVTGTAAGSAAITNVFFSLNQSTRTNAATTNSWTDWTADVTLIPGTNFFSASAVDTNGVRSLTNTVKFIYYLTDAPTVRTNGNGTIKPSYNGLQLMLGATYTMTATATGSRKGGFGFRNWTDGSNNVVTNGATLKFVMASNLTFTANFGDNGKPVLALKSTTANTNGITGDFVLHGSATDNVGVTNVQYQLNQGLWQTAFTTNNWTNWDAGVVLQPGQNVFNAYAVDTSSNVSPVYVVTISYNTAPMSLSGQVATVTDLSGNNLSTVGFGKNIFSQIAQGTNDVNGVGSYTFVSSGGYGSLKVKYIAPPIAAARGSRIFQLTFLNTNSAFYSTTNVVATNFVVVVTNNLVVTTNTIHTNLVTTSFGYMSFASISNLALGSKNILGQLLWTVGSAGDAHGVLFQKGKYTTQALLSTATNGGSYTYSQYSPVGSLFKLTGTNGTSYVLASFAATNHGLYYEEDYDGAGHTNGTDNGHFLVAGQKPGGNAPLALTNQNVEITAADGSFNDQFGADTYSQDSLTTNFDTAVGSYTYSRATTNIGALNLTIIAPPTLAGSNSAARLIFVNGNGGLFTNEDGTFSTFVLTSVTNLVPASLTNTTLNLTNNPDGFFNQIGFLNDGSFTFNGVTNGFFTSTNYSPGGALVNISFTDTNGVATGYDWLQLNFKSAGSGTFFVNEFGTNDDFQDSVSGNFKLH